MTLARSGRRGGRERPCSTPAKQLYLVFSSTCPHCAEVLRTLESCNSCNFHFNPIDRIAGLDLPGVERSASWDPAVNRELLALLGIDEVPALLVPGPEGMSIIRGEKRILRSSINESKIKGDFISGGEQGTIDVSGGVSTIPALLSLRLISPGPGMRMYALVELGLYTYKTGITGTYTLAGVSTPVDESEYSFEGGFAAGGGVLFPLNEELSIDANLRYHWINDSEYSDVPTTDGTYLGRSKLFSIGVGVNWFFLLKKP